MFGTYVMYLDIGKDDDDNYDDGESSKEDYDKQSTVLLCRHHEITKDSQKYGQLPCKSCKQVHFY